MKAQDIRNKSDKELTQNLHQLQTDLMTAAIEYRTKEVKNVKQIHAIKKDIARVMTIMHERVQKTDGEKS